MNQAWSWLHINPLMLKGSFLSSELGVSPENCETIMSFHNISFNYLKGPSWTYLSMPKALSSSVFRDHFLCYSGTLGVLVIKPGSSLCKMIPPLCTIVPTSKDSKLNESKCDLCFVHDLFSTTWHQSLLIWGVIVGRGSNLRLLQRSMIANSLYCVLGLIFSYSTSWLIKWICALGHQSIPTHMQFRRLLAFHLITST